MEEKEIRLNFYKAVVNLESAKNNVETWMTKLIGISPTFRKELEERLTRSQKEDNSFDHEELKNKMMQESGMEQWMMDPNLRKMYELARSRIKPQVVGGGLTCPECGDSDRGNKMNKTPYCFKCNVALTQKGKKLRGPKIKQHKPLTEAQKRSKIMVS